LAFSIKRFSMAQARRMRQLAAAISSIMANSTPSAGAKRWICWVTRSSKHSWDSFFKTTHSARRPWRRALVEARSFPSRVTGPRERAALAREELTRLNEHISSSHRIQQRPLDRYVNSFVFNETLL